jgi:hypothetical protein
VIRLKNAPEGFKIPHKYDSCQFMKNQRKHHAPAPMGWIAFLVSAWLCSQASASPPAAQFMEERYHYQEVTGGAVKEVTWALGKGEHSTLTYTSPDERHTTTVGPGYDTLCWQVITENGKTHFTAERIGQSILVRGTFKGEPVDKRLEIDERPWYQATSLSLRGMVAADDSERVFWTIRLDTLTAHKIRAINKGVEFIESDGGQKELLRIRLTLPGMLAPFWKSDYWFSLPEGIFFRFEGPSGPPGSPMTVVKRTVD